MLLNEVPVRRLLDFAGAKTVRYVAALWILALVSFCLELGFAFLLQQFVALTGVMPAPVPGIAGVRFTLTGTTLLIALAGTARVAVAYAQTRIDGGAMEAFNHRLRLDVIARSLSAPFANTGETLTTFHHRILNASVALRSIHQLVSQSLFALGLAAALFLMNGPLSLALLAIASLAIVPMRLVNAQVRRTSERQASTFSTVMTGLGNVLRNIALIRLHNLQDLEHRRFEERLRAYTRDISRVLHADGMMNALAPLFLLTGIVIIAVAQTSRVALDSALIIPFLYLFVRFAQQFGSLAGSVTRLAHGWQDLRFMFECWTKDSGAPALVSRDAVVIESAVGWSLRNVTFGYPNQPPLVAGLDFDVPPGSLVQICGPSGSGKTSLVALMTGEATPDDGTIELISGDRRWPVERARTRLGDHLGYAGAEPYLFAGTLYDNVTYGLAADPDDDLLQRMTRVAECGFVDELPDRFAHRIDELGHGLSTGQRQRLALLRAILRQPRALILDDALSNVDAETEERILIGVRAHCPPCTIVWVSHRALAAPADATLDLQVRVEAFA